MPEKDGPLSALAGRMLSLGPHSLSVLIARLGEVEEYEEFLNLVRDFLPEREQEILHESTPAGQIAAFASHFEDRYFPLDGIFREGDIEGYSDLTRAIPIMVSGLSYDDYHEIPSDYRAGLQLMTYLIESTYEGETDRIALAEACREHVPAALLQQVPEGGLRHNELHPLLDGTIYSGLATWGDVLFASTGNAFLDTCYEDLWSGGMSVDWDRETVEELTRQWQRHEALWKTVNDLSEWLEEDLPARFEELLSFILQRRREQSGTMSSTSLAERR